jgi:molybdate transport system substrate-binding protein
MKKFMAPLAGLLGMLVAGTAPAAAAEITVMASMGDVSGVRDLAPAFEKMTGHKVIVSFEPGNAMMQKINAGAPVDIATAAPEQIDQLIRQGKVVAGTRTDFAQAGVGIAVKAGAPKPDVSTVEAFKAAMLNAKSIGYSRILSGVVAAMAMEKAGIADQVKAKTKLIEGVPVAEAVARGEVEIGLQQINVIIPVAGAEYIGPLPNALQDTIKFSAGLLAASPQPEVARAFLRFIVSPEAGPLLRKSLMEPWTE